MALIRGKKMVYLYRPYATRTTATGAILSFVTDNSRSVSTNSDTTMTKDGPIQTPEDPDITITSTSYLPKGDTMIDTLEDTMLNNGLVEAWEANLDEPILTYTLTEDTAVVAGKTYYTRSGSSPNYVYTPVENPTTANIGTYYEGTPSGKFKGIYYQGYITDLEISSPADDFVQIDIDFTANGKGARGEVTVTAEQQEVADYVFADTTTAVDDGA